MSDIDSFTIRLNEWTALPELYPVAPCYRCGKQEYPSNTVDGKIFAMLEGCDITISSDGTTITPHSESCATKRRCNCCGK